MPRAERGAGARGVGAFGHASGAPPGTRSSVSPCASATPSARLRLRLPVVVSTRSPMPARPAKVSGSAPSATPSRVISASPRVMSAARGLWPSPRPSRMPAATAITFLSAPPSSTPMTSSSEYTRKRGVAKSCCASRAAGLVARGGHDRGRLARHTSAAKLGPESAANRACGRHSANTCDMSASVSVSMPLVALTTSVPGATAPRPCVTTARTAWLGGAETTTSAPRTASPASPIRPERRRRAGRPAGTAGSRASG